MLRNLKNRKDAKGFTIIEVLIVLAIAGLILLIVFLAVPALQRNSRNTQRSSDVQAVLGAFQEYMNNNNGTLPGAATVDTTNSTVYLCATGTCTATNGTPAKLGFFNTAANSVQVLTASPGALTASSEVIYVLKGFSCNNTNAPVPSSARNIVAYYRIEPGTTAQCKES